jgi:hypothetical protein
MRWTCGYSISLQQAFPNEVFDLERSVRTLDLTHNKIGNAQFFIFYFGSVKHLSHWVNLGERASFSTWSHTFLYLISVSSKELMLFVFSNPKEWGRITFNTCLLLKFSFIFAVDIPMDISKLINMQRVVRILKVLCTCAVKFYDHML